MATINGQHVSISEKITLEDYLIREGYIFSRIAVEYNGKILSREDFGQRLLQDGDSMEIINFVAGG